ncbi:DUF2865 domain-containing protein [Methylobacterium dankookense]|uniref:DUF2865 domain-containing protein n=1 Tax=Methylobacterium dankookense TaxID=560405 RepID=A0A564G3U8_9HYPH|nr:DUF2865 domain-containing protein [Methylobacterium dankookense]GJD58012.1 hypothetical protein IFDJLNFL_3926 [Methylobacterium dankookense]VUF14638.1 hypothetical protein MTDSW087_04363 [Methylobacterium dankookense]
MAVGRRIGRALGSGGSRRQMLGTALAGLVLGLGSVTIGSSLVHASERGNLFGFLEDLFRGPTQPAHAPKPEHPSRYVNLPDPRRVATHRAVLQTPRPGLAESGSVRRHRRPAVRPVATRYAARMADGWTGQRTVCVRMCDGYLFPIGNLKGRADLPVHAAACAAACPGAPTSLYTLSKGAAELDEAVSLRGLPYKASALANIYRQRRVADCSCQPPDGAAPLPIARDATLERGDVVTTRDSARVVTRDGSGAYALEDYRTARLPRGLGRQIEGRVGALRREEQARAFRLALRREERMNVIRVAATDIGFRIPERASAGFTAVRVVAPSPFQR